MADPSASLPDGFQLDVPPAAAQAHASLPDGFVLDTHPVSNAEAAERGFIAGGGTLLNTIGALTSEAFPAPGENPIQAAHELDPTKGAGATATAEGQAAQQFAALKPGETLDTSGKISMGLGQAVPVLAGALATGGTASAEGLIPGAVKAIPYLGRFASAIGAGAPTATALTTEQIANADNNATPGSLAKEAGLNLALAGVPGALGDSALVRALTGAGLGAGTTAAGNYVEGRSQDTSQDIVGALVGGALAGGHAPAEPGMDPFLRNYQEGAADKPIPPQQAAALPAPTVEPPPQAAVTAPSGAPAAPKVDPTALAETSFRQDPKTALAALDHTTLVQVAQDAGLDVKHTDSHADIVNKVVATGPQYLQSDVLPEYLSAVKPQAGATPSLSAGVAGSQPAAETLPAGVTVPVDASGTAYTPAQGAQSFSQALDAARSQQTPPALPPAVTTVDSAGNAVDSGTVNRSIQEQLAAREQARQQAIARDQALQATGRTPDIQSAQLNHPAHTPDEMVEQTDDFAPPDNIPWWEVGQREQAAHELAKSQTPTDASIRSSDAAYGTPERHPWVDLDDTQNVPMAGAANEDGSKVYVSKYMPDTVSVDGKEIDAKEGVFVHEVEEQKNMLPDGPKSPEYMDSLKADIASEGGDVPASVLRKVEAGVPLDYVQAHNIATIRENAFIRKKYAIDPHQYQSALADGIKAAKEGAATEGGVPSDIDRRPYDDEGQGHLLDEAQQAELSKIGIPEGMHAQAMDFLGHVQEALEAGVKASDLQDIAREPSMSYADKVSLINHMTDQMGPRNSNGDVDSWIVREKATGKPVFETFNKRSLKNLNTDKYEAVPALQHLQENNGAHSSNTETQEVPRETPAPASGQAGQARIAQTLPSGTEANGDQSGAGSRQVPTGQVAEGPAQTADQQPVRGKADVSHGSDQLGVPPSLRRADYSPEVEGRAVAAIDDLVARYKGSTLADTIAQDFRETTTSQLTGKQISRKPEEAAKDLAAMANLVYRSPVIEVMRYIYTDREGNILGESAVSSRMPSSSQAFPTGVDDGAQWIKDNAPHGATHVWAMHNHPSGNPAASQPDIETTGALSIYLGDMAGAPKLAGHVILNHDHFGYIDGAGIDNGVLPVPGVEGQDPLRETRGDQGMLSVKMTSPTFAASAGKRIYAATPEDSSAVIIMDAQGRVASVHTFPNDVLASPKGGALLSRLGAKRGAVGIGIVTSAENFVQNRAAFESAKNRGLLYDAFVVAQNGSPLRLGNSDLFPKEQQALYGEHSSAAKQRSDFAQQVMENAPNEQPPLVSLSAVRRALAERGLPDDQIKAMSADQLRAEQANLRRRSEPTPEEKAEGDTTSIKNASKAEDRAAKGKDEVEYNVKRSDAEAYAQAKERMQKDPSYVARLTAELATANRPHTDVEAAALTLDATRIKNDTAVAYEKLADARAKGDEAESASALAQIRLLDSQMDANDLASRASGSEAGRALRSRQVELNDDYSIASLTKRSRDAKGGDLTSAERERLHSVAKTIAEREKAVAAREKALQDAKLEPRKPAERKAAKAKFDDLAEKLKAIAQKDQMKPGCIT